MLLKKEGKSENMEKRHTKIFMRFHWFHCVYAVLLVDGIKPGHPSSRIFGSRLPMFTTDNCAS